MSKMELLGASEAENLTKQKLKQYCGTPCINYPNHSLKPASLPMHQRFRVGLIADVMLEKIFLILDIPIQIMWLTYI